VSHRWPVWRAIGLFLITSRSAAKKSYNHRIRGAHANLFPACFFVCAGAVTDLAGQSGKENLNHPRVAPRRLQSQPATANQDATTIKFLPGPILPRDSNEVTCLKLRTYFVARVHPQRDETRVVGYTSCQRASRYEVKRAIEEFSPTDRQDSGYW
jgi:hypothetical protein